MKRAAKKGAAAAIDARWVREQHEAAEAEKERAGGTLRSLGVVVDTPRADLVKHMAGFVRAAIRGKRADLEVRFKVDAESTGAMTITVDKGVRGAASVSLQLVRPKS